MNNKKGFTLVELMVVLVIIGILATLAIPKFLGATNKAKATECKPVLKEIYTLQEAYKIELSEYADSDTKLGYQDSLPNARFRYSHSDDGTQLGVATVNGKGVKDIDGTATTDKACIDSTSAIFSTDGLQAYLNAPDGC